MGDKWIKSISDFGNPIWTLTKGNRQIGLIIHDDGEYHLNLTLGGHPEFWFSFSTLREAKEALPEAINGQKILSLNRLLLDKPITLTDTYFLLQDTTPPQLPTDGNLYYF